MDMSWNVIFISLNRVQ